MLIINKWDDVIPMQPVHNPLTQDDYETFPESEPPYMIPFTSAKDYKIMYDILKAPFKNKFINYFSINLDEFREDYKETVEILSYNQHTVNIFDKYAMEYCLNIYGNKRNIEVYFHFTKEGLVIERDYPYGELKTAYEILVQLPEYFSR